MSRGRKKKRKRASEHKRKIDATTENTGSDDGYTSPDATDRRSFDHESHLVLNLKYHPAVIDRKTRLIHDRMLDRSEYLDAGNFTKINISDLKMMFELYDELFFKDFFKRNFPDQVYFNLSTKMTRSGGKTEVFGDPKFYVIKLSSQLLFQSFDDEDREIVVNGIICHDRLEAAMRIFEHELIHLLEFTVLGNSSCSRPMFISLCIRIFGHTDVKHQLVTGYEIANNRYGLNVGEQVSFEFEGEIHQGIISRITKRATVMVENPEGQFRDLSGKSYSKYYIPLDHLKPLS
ncbi:MAG: hypothetical protein U9R75_04010 [Candidatus Thermoplasmatota archaeon]|nr:hypothetical protein [Candidatus Thermoplasmatota archaeon]